MPPQPGGVFPGSMSVTFNLNNFQKNSIIIKIQIINKMLIIKKLIFFFYYQKIHLKNAIFSVKILFSKNYFLIIYSIIINTILVNFFFFFSNKGSAGKPGGGDVSERGVFVRAQEPHWRGGAQVGARLPQGGWWREEEGGGGKGGERIGIEG